VFALRVLPVLMDMGALVFPQRINLNVLPMEAALSVNIVEPMAYFANILKGALEGIVLQRMPICVLLLLRLVAQSTNSVPVRIDTLSLDMGLAVPIPALTLTMTTISAYP